MISPLWFRIVVIALFCLIHIGQTNAENVVTLVAGERPPYIGASLPENGYVSELAREAFKRKGYVVKITFYPWARSKMLAARGSVDGMLPAYYDSGDAT